MRIRKKTSITVPPDLWKKLKALAAKRYMSASTLLIQLILDALEADGKR